VRTIGLQTAADAHIVANCSRRYWATAKHATWQLGTSMRTAYTAWNMVNCVFLPMSPVTRRLAGKML